ncbi:acetolactate decarboxylase [Candidatus Gracilibacteria bacterium]|nr:acetolactate decarboxylase [Candidatus Gracilibacteria bacterium]
MTKKRIAAIRDFIDTAEKSLKNAKKLLKEILEEENIDLSANLDLDTKGLSKYDSGDNKIVEGVFTGEEMLGSDGNKYPVPVNYASKSKLVQGDKMKLTIEGSGKMLYKQIKQIERETKVGLLTQNNGKYQIISDGVAYDVLTAAVTHFKASIGDTVTILIPAGKEATFGAIEAVMPKE